MFVCSNWRKLWKTKKKRQLNSLHGTSVTAKVTKRSFHPYCSFAFERRNVKNNCTPLEYSCILWLSILFNSVHACLPPDDQATTLKQPDKVRAVLKMLRNIFKTFERVYLVWDGGERCILQHLTNVRHQHIWSVHMVCKKLHIKE